MSTSILRRAARAAACCAFILCAGCGSKPEIIKIGAILPLSGTGANVGNQHLRGLQLAIEELNASNPLVQFELVVASDQNDQGAALDAFKDQLVNEKILVSFVVARASCLAVAHQAEVEFVPVFANCRHPLITTMHGNTFRIVPSTTLEIRTTARFLTASLKVDAAAVLYFNDDDGNDAAKAFRNELPQSGVRLLAIEPFIDDAAVVKSAVSVGARPGSGRGLRLRRRESRGRRSRRAPRGRIPGSRRRFVGLSGSGFRRARGEIAGRVLLFRSRDRAHGIPGFRRQVSQEIQRGADGERRLRIRRDAYRREGGRYQARGKNQHRERAQEDRQFQRRRRRIHLLRAGMAPPDERRARAGRFRGRRILINQRRRPV